MCPSGVMASREALFQNSIPIYALLDKFATLACFKDAVCSKLHATGLVARVQEAQRRLTVEVAYLYMRSMVEK